MKSILHISFPRFACKSHCRKGISSTADNDRDVTTLAYLQLEVCSNFCNITMAKLFGFSNENGVSLVEL